MKILVSLLAVLSFQFEDRSFAEDGLCPELQGEYLSELEQHDEYESFNVEQEFLDGVTHFYFEEGEGGDQYTIIADHKLRPSYRNGADAEMKVEGEMSAGCEEDALLVQFLEETSVKDLNLTIISLREVRFVRDRDGQLVVQHQEDHQFSWGPNNQPPSLEDPRWETVRELGLPEPGRLNYRDVWYPLD